MEQPTLSQINEMDAFFTGITIPKVVRINKAIVQTDAPRFVKENITMLKDGVMAPPIVASRWRHLVELKEAILADK